MEATKSEGSDRYGNRCFKLELHHEMRGCLILDKGHVCRLVVKVSMGGPGRSRVSPMCRSKAQGEDQPASDELEDPKL